MVTEQFVYSGLAEGLYSPLVFESALRERLNGEVVHRGRGGQLQQEVTIFHAERTTVHYLLDKGSNCVAVNVHGEEADTRALESKIRELEPK
ncbi:TPA: hypothetical protein HA241_06825 [Candidatus Woesearchaeota archaeon]|nr:hypothetical protein [Candidatus Woesearchaeota archaeon]